MTKVKCIKDTIGFEKGEVYDVMKSENCNDSFSDYVLFADVKIYLRHYPEYFQEVKEEETKIPRWKVGDKVVYDDGKFISPMFSIVVSIYYNPCCLTQYGLTSNGIWYNEKQLREPTQEELELYFR